MHWHINNIKEIKVDYINLLKPGAFEQPGVFRCKAVLTLHSKEALKLFAGRPAPEGDEVSKDFSVNNLKKFGKRMNPIWFAAQYNDPYADWFLYQIEQKMERLEQAMADETAKLNALLERVNVASAKVLASQSLRPLEIPLDFANPYSYRGAFLIGTYDVLIRALMAACHVSLMDRQGRDSALNVPAKQIRKLFMMAGDWKFTGITRDTYDPASDKVREAEGSMGALPQGFLDGTTRANVAPDIRGKESFALPQDETTAGMVAPLSLVRDAEVTPINSALGA